MAKKKNKQPLVKPGKKHNGKASLSKSRSQEDFNEEGKRRFWVPNFFIENKMLGDKQDEKWKKPEAWVEFYQKKGTLNMLKKVFFEGKEKDIPMNILRSLHSPCERTTSNQEIAWTFANKPIRQSNTHSSSYSIQSLAKDKADKDKAGKNKAGKNKADKVISNLIYDQNGKSRFQVDFQKHGKSDSGHLHELAPGNFERKDGEEHSFSWDMCPWIWLAIPEAYGKLPQEEINNEESGLITVNYAPDKEVPKETSKYTKEELQLNLIVLLIFSYLITYLNFLKSSRQEDLVVIKNELNRRLYNDSSDSDNDEKNHLKMHK